MASLILKKHNFVKHQKPYWNKNLTRLSPRRHMSTSRVYEPIYTVKNVYNL